MRITNNKWNPKEKSSPKVHKAKYHTVKGMGVAGASSLSKQMEGGEEISQASVLAYEASKPIGKVTKVGSNAVKSYQVKQYQKEIAQKELRKTRKSSVRNTSKKATKKVTKKATMKSAKQVAKSTTKNVTKKVVKDSVKTTTKVATTTGATVAGTAVAPVAGTAIGLAASYVAGVKVEQLDTKLSNQNRMFMFLKDKLGGSGEQRDSLGLVLCDIVRNQFLLGVKTVGPILGLLFLVLLGAIFMIAMPILLVLAIIYHSPFAIFFPPLEEGDTVQSVASAYVSEFHQEATSAMNASGYDESYLVYVDYEGMEAMPSNYYDILGIYMVKYGMEDMATVINEISKTKIQDVVDDMCHYSTRVEEESYVYLDEEGIEQEGTKRILYVNVHLKSYLDMIGEYDFTEEQIELIHEFMTPEYLSMLGWTGGSASSGGGNVVSLLSDEEIEEIVAEISDPQVKQALIYALSKVGYPYSQDLRHSGTHYDCSSLVYYAYLSSGIDISYGGATTAAYECKGLEEAGKGVDRNQLQAGDLLFYRYANNGRYKNIGHVAMYVGDGKVVEAANTRLGVIYRDLPSPASIVSVARPSM